MFRKFATLAVCIACLGMTTSCLLDPKETPDPPETPPAKFKDLTEREDVLFNLELAYNQRGPTSQAEYDRLLDDAFIFYFSPEDYANGKTPEQWDRSSDVPATQRLLQDALNLDLDLQGQISWVAVVPQDFPDETWYTTTVNYTFTMRFGRDPETTWITSGQPQVQFTVREVDVDGQTQWRLVEWRDLAANTG